jgi:hypothetical protein
MNINPMQFMNQLNQLKAKGGDPNQMIQQMLNSGRISQGQYNEAVKMAQQIQQMLTPGGHR